MKQNIKDLLQLAGIKPLNQFYSACYYIGADSKLHFLHVIECEPDTINKKNSFLACFGLPDGYSFTVAELNAHLMEWLKTNTAEKYEARTPYERMRDISNFETNFLLK